MNLLVLRSIFVLTLFSVVDGRAADRPNVLWLSCEDISSHLGCYGDPVATTPHLDAFAKRGILYRNAFAAAGVCAPCRSTIITGMYQTSIGTHHMRCSVRLPEHIQPFTIGLRDAGYYCTNNSKTDYQFRAPKGTWDDSSRRAHWKNRPSGKPFFSVFNYTGCHESGIANVDKYRSVTKGITKHDRQLTAKTLPPYYPDTKVTREDWGRYYDVVTAMDRWFAGHLQALDEAGLAESTVVVFWSDHGVGLPRAKRWLYDSGMRVPLIVSIPSRFRRAGQPQPGTVSDRLVSLMDLGPTTLDLAGLKIPRHMQGRPFLGAAPARDYVFGARDRMDERYDIIRAVRDKRFKYIRNYEPLKAYYQYMNTPEKGATMREIRRVAFEGNLPTAAAVFMARSKALEELYDTASDPHELRNLAGDKAYREELERLRRVHLEWVGRTRDLGLVPESEIEKRAAERGSAYAVFTGAGADALVHRIRVAAQTSLEGPAARPRMELALADSDSIVRYWGAIGLGNLAGEGGDGAVNAKKLRELLSDPSECVRVASARALCRMNLHDGALDELSRILDGGSQWARLRAAIVLDELDESARPALAAMKRNKAYRDGLVAKGKYVVRVLNYALNELLGTDEKVK